MKRILRLLPLASGIPLLLSCGSLDRSEPQEKAALRVEPVFSIRNSGGNVQDYYQLGRYYQGQQRFDLAIDAYRRALELNKDYVEARNAIATSYAAQGDYDKAIAEFQTALGVAPQAAHIYNNLGYTYYLQKNYVGAVAAYDKALTLDPQNVRTSNNLAQARAQLNDNEKARIAALRTQSPPMASARHADETGPAAIEKQVQPLTSVAKEDNSRQSKAAEIVAVLATPIETTVAPQTVPVKIEAALPAKAEPAPVKPARFEISNGNGVNGMAKRTANTLMHEGVPAARLTNQIPYRQLETVIQYREGFREQAVSLSQKFVNPPALAASAKLRTSTDVRLVLGWDLRGSGKAVFVSDKAESKLALETANKK